MWLTAVSGGVPQGLAAVAKGDAAGAAPDDGAAAGRHAAGRSILYHMVHTVSWCRRGSPLSQKVTLAALRQLAGQPLGSVLQADFRSVHRMVHGPSDFGEGVRATLIDRDGKPRWSPPTLEEVPSFSVCSESPHRMITEHRVSFVPAAVADGPEVPALLEPFSARLVCCGRM